MYEYVMVETLSGTFNAFLEGGNVYNVMLHGNAATLRKLTSFICVLYYVVSENHSVLNFPWGGDYSQLKAYKSRTFNVANISFNAFRENFRIDSTCNKGEYKCA